MKRIRLLTKGIMLAAVTAMLCSCGNSASPKESPKEVEKEKSIAEVYEQTMEDHIYKLSQIDTEGYSLENGYVQDDYVLLVMRTMLEEGYESEYGTDYVSSAGKLLLFPLTKPEQAVSKDIEGYENRYTLLEGGQVLATDRNGSYILYNSELEEVNTSQVDADDFLGSSEDGDVWFFKGEKDFFLCREGEVTQLESEEALQRGSYLGKAQDKSYFKFFDEFSNEVLISFDLKDKSYEKCDQKLVASNQSHGILSYDADHEWQIASMDDMLMITSFPKQSSKEVYWGMDENYLISEIYDMKEGSEDFYTELVVYDQKSGGFCERKRLSDILEQDVVLCSYDQGMILFQEMDERREICDLYLWDISESNVTEAATYYLTLNYTTSEESIDQLASEIKEQYGVQIYYTQDHLLDDSGDYELFECKDKDLINYTLISLKELMTEYPKGFFEELKADDIESITYLLVDSYIVHGDGCADPIATARTWENKMLMTIDVHYWKDLRMTFLHENMHLMDHRIEQKVPELSGDTNDNYVGYWATKINSEDCPLMYSYSWEHTEENLKGVYDHESDPTNAYYVDWYAKSTFMEDQARTLEYCTNPETAYYLQSPHINRKARFLRGLIREIFPCVKNSNKPVFWEQNTGIVDLYEEFPDFVAR